jgi:hypothetical protein
MLNSSKAQVKPRLALGFAFLLIGSHLVIPLGRHRGTMRIENMPSDLPIPNRICYTMVFGTSEGTLLIHAAKG